MKTARVAIASVVVLGAFVACGKSEAPPAVANAERTTCSADADCVVTTFSGCCAYCEGAPKAMAKSILEQQQNRCAAVDCKAPPENVLCAHHEPADAFVARCKDGTCVSAKR